MMKQRIPYVILLTIGLAVRSGYSRDTAVPDAASESPSQDEGESGSWETITHVTRSARVSRLAETLQFTYAEDPRVQLQRADSGDLIVLRVRPALRAEVLELVRALDRPPRIIAITISFIQLQGSLESLPDLRGLDGTLGEVGSALKAAEQAGMVRIHERFQINAVEHEPTSIHVGYQKRLPMESETELAGDPRIVHLGTLCGVTARVTDDGTIYLAIQFARSALRDIDLVADAAESVESSAIVTMQTRTTVSLQDGNARLISLAREQPGDDSPAVLLLVGARTLEKKPADTSPSAVKPAARPAAHPAAKPAAKTAAKPTVVEMRQRRYIRALIRKYDRNGDGVLQQAEWKEMRRDPTAADANGDGRINDDELLEWMLRR